MGGRWGVSVVGRPSLPQLFPLFPGSPVLRYKKKSFCFWWNLRLCNVVVTPYLFSPHSYSPPVGQMNECFCNENTPGYNSSKDTEPAFHPQTPPQMSVVLCGILLIVFEVLWHICPHTRKHSVSVPQCFGDVHRNASQIIVLTPMQSLQESS